MIGWLRKLVGAKARTADRAALLDEGLGLAMDWGESWLAPIQERLRQRHPHLSPAELDDLDATCRQAMAFGHETMHALVRAAGKNVVQDQFAARLAAQISWASTDNIARLFNQSLYHVWKTGGPAGRA